MSKDVGAEGRFDIFLDSGVDVKTNTKTPTNINIVPCLIYYLTICTNREVDFKKRDMSGIFYGKLTTAHQTQRCSAVLVADRIDLPAFGEKEQINATTAFTASTFLHPWVTEY